eukprot:GILI01016871.1.p2 GENE.GILI01016871.1~~GILI01016871.1.p2  ORF type:complete len:286 (-),score=125.70 GILI01016871.1:198-1055(-)
MPPKQSQKKAKEADDFAFLEEQAKLASSAKDKLKEQKAEQAKAKAVKDAEDAKKAKAEEETRIAAMQALPPVYVDEVVRTLVELKGGLDSPMRDMCWLAYCLNNFFAFVVETHRRLHVRTEAAKEGEPVLRFECHDLEPIENCEHSWNVIHTPSGIYSIDVTLRQFPRYGYQRDEVQAEGYVPTKGASRLIKLGETKTHQGVIAKDGGVLPESGSTIVKHGVPAGRTKKYLSFLAEAGSNRVAKMSPAEQKTAHILHAQGSANSFADVQEKLAAKFYTADLLKKL